MKRIAVQLGSVLPESRRAFALGILALSLVCASRSEAQEPFGYLWIQSSVSGASFGTVSWADVDADADLDLLLVASTGVGSPVPSVKVFKLSDLRILETTTGNRRPVAEFRSVDAVANSTNLWLSRVDWADYDLDGDLDAVVVGTAQTAAPFAATVQVYRNDGPLAFTALGASVSPLSGGDVSWADYDNDGDPDLLLTGSGADGVASSILYRNDAGVFSMISSNLPGTSFGSSDWADADQDGDLDVALCGIGDDGRFISEVHRNNGVDGFERMFAGNGVAYCSVEWGDYDQDGFPDLLVSGGRLSHTVLSGRTDLYRNLGGSGLQRVEAGVVGVVAGEARFADVDNDGALDIFVLGGRDIVFGRQVGAIYRNEAGAFRHVANVAGTFPGSASFGDLDQDLDLDLAVIGLDRDRQSITNLYLNGELIRNEAPLPPTGLQSTVDGGEVTFAWNPGSDSRTATPALTYNLRVGTVPGGGDVMSVPMTSRGTAVQSRRGNVGWNTGWILRDRPNGTYYWSVQTVDNSLAVSTFSENASFEVTASSGIKPVGVDDVGDGISRLRLELPYPNPSSGSVTFNYQVPRAGTVDLRIFDVLGREVAALSRQVHPAGVFGLQWDGKGNGGYPLSAGVYICRMTFEGTVLSRTFTVGK